LFSLPRLGNGVGGAVAALLVRVEAHASSSCSRVLQQGEEGGERLAVALLQTVEREEQLLGTRKSSLVSASFPLASLFSQKISPLSIFSPLFYFSYLSFSFLLFFSSILPLFSIPFSLLSSRFTLCHCSSSIFGR
jgi:hypothetical protein